MEDRDGGPFRPEGLDLLPIQSLDHAELGGVRDEVLQGAKTDGDLLRIACAARRSGNEEWLCSSIERDLGSRSSGVIARGLTLAGMLDAQESSEELWSGRLAVAPSLGWLREVHRVARSTYTRNRWARHWLMEFAEESDRDAAFGAHALFLACADRRALIWAPELLDQRRERIPDAWCQHWSLRWGDLMQRVKKSDDKLGKTLYGTKPFTRTQAPWL